jgi:D-beta-D-heptose 7-phosphate kinase/D-beta-D-heptose 1-phosphate adenosyltransferase
MSSSKILVIGDVMLDEYWFGDSDRISPEAPTPIVNVVKKEYRIGGAGNVALNLFELGANVTLICSIGKDLEGKILKNILKKKFLKNYFLIKKSKTIKKLRIFCQNNQMIRLDIESNKDEYKIKLDKNLKKQIDKSNLIILSDYGKGALSDVKNIIKYAKSKRKLIIIDPKGSNFLKYSNATILTPNYKEFLTVVGEVKNKTDFKKKSRDLIKKIKIKGLLITQGKDGMTLVTKDKIIHRKSFAQDVFDVTGAGDTVIATFSSYLNNGSSLIKSMEMANIAASIVIKKIGTATANKKEIEEILNHSDIKLNKKYYKNKKDLFKLLQHIKSKNKKIVLTNGCFDILHPGHIHLLQEAKKLGNFLIVAINSDNSVNKLKGSGRPFNRLSSRIKMLTSLACVDLVISFNEISPENIIKKISPDILVKGGDYKVNNIIGGNYVKSYNGQVKVIKLKKGHSTSKILSRN